MQLRTRTEGQIMTFGLLDRLILWATYKLNDLHERRTERFWEREHNRVG